MPDPTPAAEAILQRIASESSARIAAADQEADEAQVAFAAGKFGEYIDAKYGAAAQEVIDGHNRQAADGGDREASG